MRKKFKLWYLWAFASEKDNNTQWYQVSKSCSSNYSARAAAQFAMNQKTTTDVERQHTMSMTMPGGVGIDTSVDAKHSTLQWKYAVVTVECQRRNIVRRVVGLIGPRRYYSNLIMRLMAAVY